jgi:hypothetical protein
MNFKNSIFSKINLIIYCNVGRCSFTRRLKGIADKVSWDEDGSHYLLVMASSVQIYAVTDNSCLTSIQLPLRINQAVFLPNTMESNDDQSKNQQVLRVAMISDDKKLYVYNILGNQVS